MWFRKEIRCTAVSRRIEESGLYRSRSLVGGAPRGSKSDWTMRSKYRWAGVFISANPECHSPITDRTGTRPPRNPAAPFSASFSGCWIFFAHSRSHNLCVRLPLSGALGSVLSLCTLSCYGCYCYCCSYFIFFLISPLFCVLPCYFFFVTLDVIASGSETTTTKRVGAASEMSPSDAYQLALRRSYLPDWLYS